MSTPIATAGRILAAAGLSGDALFDALAVLEREMLAAIQTASSPALEKNDAAERRKAFDRERKRKAAAEKKALADAGLRNSTGIPAESAEIPQNGRNSGGTVEVAPTLPLSPNDLFSNPQTPTHPDNIPTREAVPFEAHVAAWLEWQATKPKRKRKAEKPEVSAGTPDRPDDVSEQVWSDFLKHRRKHRADLTATALAGFRREADRVGWPLERAIEESILRNWRGFKADWVKNDDRSGYGNSGRGTFAGDRQPRPRTDGFTDAINDALARSGSGFASGPSGRWGDDHAAGDQGLRPARARVIR